MPQEFIDEDEANNLVKNDEKKEVGADGIQMKEMNKISWEHEDHWI